MQAAKMQNKSIVIKLKKQINKDKYNCIFHRINSFRLKMKRVEWESINAITLDKANSEFKQRGDM